MTFLATSLLVLATSWHLEAPRLQPDDALAQYEKSCIGKKRAHHCDQLRLQVEQILFQDLRVQVYVGDKKIPRDVLSVAAQSDLLPLKRLGMVNLASRYRRELTEPERAVLTAELNSPYPGLRRTAWTLFNEQGDHGQEYGVRTIYRRPFGAYGGYTGTRRGLLPEREPALLWTTVPRYPKAEFQYYASGAKGGLWMTTDSHAQVLEFYRRFGEVMAHRTVIENFEKGVTAKIENMKKEFEKVMASGASPEEMQREMEALGKGGASPSDTEWLSGVGWGSREMKRSEITHVVLEKTRVGGVALPRRSVVIWKDLDLKRTGIAIVYRDLPEP